MTRTSYIWPHPLPYGDPRHGKRGTYVYYRCRCPECTEASRLAKRLGNAVRAEQLKADPSLALHGAANTYVNWNCRCERCLAAFTAKMTANRRHKTAR